MKSCVFEQLITGEDGSEQVCWPVHCVQNTQGAELSDQLRTETVQYRVLKGVESHLESYSAFNDLGGHPTGLEQYLQGQGVKKVFCCGVATDYCVKFSVLDSCKAGFETFVLEDLIRGVGLKPNDIAEAKQEMVAAGATWTTSACLTL